MTRSDSGDGAESGQHPTHIPADVASTTAAYNAMPQQGFAQQIQTGIANSNMQTPSTSQHSVVNVSDTAAYSRATDKPDGFLGNSLNQRLLKSS